MSVALSPPKQGQTTMDAYLVTANGKKRAAGDSSAASSSNKIAKKWTLDNLAETMMTRFEDARETFNRILKMVTELKMETDQVKDENTQQAERIRYLEKKTELLEHKLEGIEVKQRDKNLVIFGLEKPPPNENLIDKAERFLHVKLNLNIQVEAATFLGNRGPLLIELANKKDKFVIFKNCNKLRGSKISIQNDYTATTREKRKAILPTFKKLRGEGKAVSLRGAQIFLNGKRFEAEEVEMDVSPFSA